jgi:hypothetical protein
MRERVCADDQKKGVEKRNRAHVSESAWEDGKLYSHEPLKTPPHVGSIYTRFPLPCGGDRRRRPAREHELNRVVAVPSIRHPCSVIIHPQPVVATLEARGAVLVSPVDGESKVVAVPVTAMEKDSTHRTVQNVRRFKHTCRARK